MFRRADVLVVGAGPAGATAALNLAPYRTVLLADAAREPVRRIGESLLPAAGRLLRDMGLFDSFQELNMLPWYANQSVWESERGGEESDFLRSPDGPGWHLDRPDFEMFLRCKAEQRGAELLAPAKFESIERGRDGFRVTLRTDADSVEVSARFVIDAGGRSSPVGRQLGARRQTDLHLVCAGLYGRARSSSEGAGITFVEAVQDGWWYTSPLPGGRRVLAFHTDCDHPNARCARTTDGLLAHAEATSVLAGLLHSVEFAPEHQPFHSPASGSVLAPCGGDNWLATGDAALTFDPLSSQGLLNALYLGLAAAEAAHRHLAGEVSATAQYRATVAEIRAAYRRGLGEAYAQVRRWPDSPFWLRRAGH